MSSKNPGSDVQFATAVAYYHKFEAPPGQRKNAINSDDLQEACRTTGRTRLSNPNKTLTNALSRGYLDRSGERGTFAINTVGENLIVVALPEGTGQASNNKGRGKRRSKQAKKPKKKMRR
jgi:hypothetical protein